MVYLTSPNNRQARTRIDGEVIDYTGRQLVVRLDDGRELKRPGQHVVSIETEWPKAKAEGDRFFDEQQFAEAREKYVTAIRKEDRPWARRMIVARIVACYRESNQLEPAGKLFIALVREDPDTPYFDQIPLTWLPGDAPAQSETALQWMREENPVAALLGASHLVTTNQRAAALDRLLQMTLDKDARIRSLAEAQRWRVEIPSANDEQLAEWEREVATYPESLRAGPYWLLGRGLAQHGQNDRAVLALLRVPVFYPAARSLAVDALFTAALLMEKQGDRSGATRLREELVTKYPQTNLAAEARAALPPAPAAKPAPLPEQVERSEAAFLTGLRARRLFTLVEQYCRRRLTDTGLSDSDRIDLSVELSRTLTEHAMHEAATDREPLWNDALAAVKLPEVKGSRRLLADTQAALVHLAHGELARQEAELAGSAAASLESARDELRAAVAQLQSVAKSAEAELRQAKPAGRTQGNFDEHELAALRRNVDFQLARAFRNQGESYPAKSDDRTNSLRQAVEKLDLLTAGDASDPADRIAWPARIDEVVCLRLLENFERAAERLQALHGLEPPAWAFAALDAEAVRLLLDQHHIAEALAAVEKILQLENGQRSADLDYACLQAYVAAWREASKSGQTAEAGRWQDSAADMIRRIDERYGRYWSRRAEMLLAGNVAHGGQTQNLAVLVRAAESLYRSGQFDEAVAAYDRAARQAGGSKEPAAAFDYAYTAAAIEQHCRRYGEAARRFRSAALAHRDNAKAGEAHLLAIYNLALASKAGEPSDDLPPYADLLAEHLERWPESPTANEARLWLGQFYESRGRWQDAIAAYQNVIGPKAATALESAFRCHEKRLSAMAEAGEPTAEPAAAAADGFERLVLGSRGSLPEHFSEIERLAATSAASLWLQYTSRFADAERLLAAALADSADAPDDWKATAQTLQILAIAGQGRRAEAGKLLSECSEGRAGDLLVLIEGLDRAAAKAPKTVAAQLAQLQLDAAKLLRPLLKELSADDRLRFERTYLRALSQAKQFEKAIAAARTLAEEHPRDGELQEEYARLLVESPNRVDWESGLTKWRDIGRKTRQGSDRWLRSIYYQAWTLERLDQHQQSARLVKLAESLVPGLGGEEMSAKFAKLRDDRPTKGDR